jgi:electron transfer flavoprotein beta subunit
VHIVVLLKAVPIVGTEHLDAAFRTDRAQLEANGNDEYTLEKALKLADANPGTEVSLLTMGPASAVDALRKGLAMGATRAYHVQDDGLAASGIRATVDVLVAALRKIDFDLLFIGADSSDGLGGVVGAAVAARLGLPYLSYASEIEPSVDGSSVTVHRLSAAGYDVLTAPLPAVVMGTQVLGEPRYPSLRGIMQARSKETNTWSLADLGVEAASVGAAAAATSVLSADPPPQRAGATIVREAPDEAVSKVVDFLAARRLI